MEVCGGSLMSSSSVPAFLTKLWTLVEDPETDSLICWSPNGTSFHVFDQGRFSKDVLPKYFKHNNMASFIRQLNMYGFRKVVHIEQGGLLKPERDDTEFQHPFFIRGEEHLLEIIKRKVTNVSSGRQEEMKLSPEEVNKILSDVQLMKGKQETIDSRIVALKHENEALWREVAILRQKHSQQQKVVNKLIEFLVSLVQSNRIMGTKRKLPLMLGDTSSTHSLPKYSRPFSLEALQAVTALSSAASLLPASESPVSSGPIIFDVTDVASPEVEDVDSDWTDAGGAESISPKVDRSSPEVEASPILEGGPTAVDTPLSPTTFINSILQEHEEAPNRIVSTSATPVSVTCPTFTGPQMEVSTSQSTASVTCPNPAASSAKCQTVACIDRSELLDHVDRIDNSLENLQSVLTTPTFTFDASPLMEFFSSSGSSGDLDLDSLDILLSDSVPRGSDKSIDTGKQLVQYTAVPPMLMTEPITSEEDGVDLPSLLELEAEPFSSATEDLSADPLTPGDLNPENHLLSNH